MNGFKNPLLMLIDGHSLAYRSFFAFVRNPLRNSKGENTSAAFAFTNSLIKLLREWEPDYVALVFDAKGPTFRHEQLKTYKANRPKAPDELSMQIEWIHQIGRGFGLKIFEIPGYEADDIMATLAIQAEKKGIDVILVTSDKDLLQLVDEKIKVLDTRPKEDILYTTNTVIDKFGVLPEKIPDLLGLMGDSIDNIPGVPGIGEKTAKDLLKRYGSLEQIFESLDEIGRKNVKEALLRHRESALLSRNLAILEVKAPVILSLPELKPKEMDRKGLLKLFKRLEFFKLMEYVAEPLPNIEIGEGLPQFDGEGISLAVYENDAILAKKSDKNRVWKAPIEAVKGILSDPEREKWTFDSKRLQRILLDKKIKVKNISFDLMLAEYLLSPGKARYDIDSVALERLGFLLPPEEPKHTVGEVFVVQNLKEEVESDLKRLDLFKLYQEIEIPLAIVLATMENRGVLVDRLILVEMDRALQKKLAELEEEIYKLAGIRFNINSPKQLQFILFEKIGLKPIKKTKTGYSTDQEVLFELAKEHELPRILLTYREIFKLRSTYVVSLLNLIDPGTGRIYPTFNQTGTVTGRVSCSEPNLQNIPIRSEIGKYIRKAFVAPRGFLLLSADYSQIELRILAHITGDENLANAFREGRDIHTETASRLFNKSFEEISPNERRRAKVVNFGIAYGISPFGLSKELGITPGEAQDIITNYFFTYQKVKKWIEETLKEARKEGFISTLMGRRRYLPEINDPMRQVRELAERMAINTPIQGSAADLIKKAMVDIHRDIVEKNKAHLILQVHDELLLEVPKDRIEEVREEVKKKMEDALALSVPVKVDIGIGENWLDAHP